jgi:hypothetical protein
VLTASGVAMAWPPWRHHMSVNIINNVGENGTGESPISVHCKSRDSDLGQQTVMPNQMYGFGFYPNFWGTTLFWCTFNWGRAWQAFTVWQDIGPFPGEHSRKRPCNQCVYIVRGQEGFLRSEGKSGPYKKIYGWIYPLQL